MTDKEFIDAALAVADRAQQNDVKLAKEMTELAAERVRKFASKKPKAGDTA